MKTLVVCPKTELHDYFQLWLKQWGLNDSHFVQSAEAAIEVLRKQEHIDLVIADQKLPKLSGAELFGLLKLSHRNIAFILCGTPPEEDSGIPYISAEFGPSTQPELERLVRQLTQFRNAESEINSKYTPIRPETLYLLGILPCDVFLKLNEQKFVRLKKREDFFENLDLENYKRKGVANLYIRTGDIELVLKRFAMVLSDSEDGANDLLENLDELLAQSNDQELREEVERLKSSLANDDKTEAASIELSKLSVQHQKVLQRTIKKLGAAPEVASVVKASVRAALKTFDSQPELKELMQMANQNKDEYLIIHPIMLSHALCAISNRMGWNSQILSYQLCICAFLHDIYLTDPDIAKIKFKDQLMKMPANEVATSRVLNHPKMAADLASRLHLVSASLERVLADHHEFPDGIGFPLGLKSTELSMASCVFIFAHELVDYVLEHADNVNAVENFYRTHSKNFREGGFKKVFQIVAGYSPDVGKIKVRES